MFDTLALDVQPTSASRLAQLDPSNMEFGKLFADHMLAVEFIGGEWQQPRIVPYGPLAVSPANSALHYGQAIFEGMESLSPNRWPGSYVPAPRQLAAPQRLGRAHGHAYRTRRRIYARPA